MGNISPSGRWGRFNVFRWRHISFLTNKSNTHIWCKVKTYSYHVMRKWHDKTIRLWQYKRSQDLLSLICLFLRGDNLALKLLFFTENFHVCRKIPQNFVRQTILKKKSLVLKRDVFQWNSNLNSGGGNLLIFLKADLWLSVKCFLKMIRT